MKNPFLTIKNRILGRKIGPQTRLDSPQPRKPTENQSSGGKNRFLRKFDSEHGNSTPEHAKSVLGLENGSPKPPAASPTLKNLENEPKTRKIRKNTEKTRESLCLAHGHFFFFVLFCFACTGSSMNPSMVGQKLNVHAARDGTGGRRVNISFFKKNCT